MQKGQDMKKIGIAYLIIISLLAVIFLIADYKGAVTGDDIQENISSSAHIIRSEDISSSKVVLFIRNELENLRVMIPLCCPQAGMHI